MVSTFPPRPQFAGAEPPHADFGSNGAASPVKETDSFTAALLFSMLKTCISGSSTYLSRNLKLFLILTSNWLRRGVTTDPGETNWMVSEAWPRTVPAGKILAPGVQPTQFFG